jgi:hypothetical protein
MMKSGAEVLTAAVSVEKEVLVVPFPFPPPLPLPIGACLSFVATFFFDTPDFGGLAGAFLAGVFLVLAMV